VKQQVLVGVCLAVLAGVAAASTNAAKTFPLKVKVPQQGRLDRFGTAKFTETVTCRQACKVGTTVRIKAKMARRLGFRHISGKYVVIARNNSVLKARTPTEMRFVLTREAKRRLGRSKAAVAIYGSVRSAPTARPAVSYSVGWASKLT
jgi:hypothetical protein